MNEGMNESFQDEDEREDVDVAAVVVEMVAVLVLAMERMPRLKDKSFIW